MSSTPLDAYMCHDLQNYVRRKKERTWGGDNSVCSAGEQGKYGGSRLISACWLLEVNKFEAKILKKSPRLLYTSAKSEEIHIIY